MYCTHICPHGALQQLLRRLRLPRWKIPGRLRVALRRLPGAILIAAIICTILKQNESLASWEPFNAWIWYVAGTTSLALAGLSVVFSASVPMAWCRYGCGTGRLLEYLRRSADATRIRPADIVLVGLTAWAWLA